MSRPFHFSLSARLLSVFVLTALASVFLLASLFTRGLGSQWQRAIAPHLGQYVAYIRDDIGMPPKEDRARDLASRLPVDIQVHRKDTLMFTTRNSPSPVNELKFFTPRRLTNKLPNRLTGTGLTAHTIAYNEDNRRPVLRYSEDDYTIYVEMGTPRGRGRGLDEMIFAIGGLALLLGICYLVIRRLLAPIGRLQATVQGISDGDLSVRTSESGNNDLAQLANSVDTMAERIQKMLDAKRDLLLAISHELRSPLTRARVAADLVEQSSFQQKILQNINEMESLIAQLVESERLQEHSILSYQTVELNALLASIVDSLDADINWHPHKKTVNIEADETRLILLVKNLLINALTHGKAPRTEFGNVSLALYADSTAAHIVVNDEGPGINTKHLGSVTDAFYRPDESRTRSTGGFGLGLFLCKRITEAHGGTLLIESPGDSKSGTKVSVTLPLSKN